MKIIFSRWAVGTLGAVGAVRTVMALGMFCLTSGLEADEAPVRNDLSGDPLPKGARVRMGTTRLRHAGAGQFFVDGKTLLSAGGDGVLRQWELATGKQVKEIKLQHPDTIFSVVAVSRDGMKVATQGKSYDAMFVQQRGDVLASSPLCVWEVSTGKALAKLQVRSERSSSSIYEVMMESTTSLAAFSPDGNRLAIADDGQLIRLWDLASGKELRAFPHRSLILAFAFSPDGKTIAVACEDKTVRLWEVATGKELLQFRGHAGNVSAVVFSPDGQKVASGGGDGIRLWEATTGKEVQKLQGPQQAAVQGIAAAMQNRLGNLPQFQQGARTVVFSPDGKILASWEQNVTENSESQVIRLWDLAAGTELRSLSLGETNMQEMYMNLAAAMSSGMAPMAFSPDGKMLVSTSGSADPRIRLWDVATGEPIVRGQGHEAAIQTLSFLADGKALVTESSDKTTRLWETATGKELRKLETKEGGDQGFAFSSDNKILAIAGADKNIRLTSPDGETLRTLKGGTPAAVMRFSPDNQLLITCGVGSGGWAQNWQALQGGQLDAKLHAWHVTTGKKAFDLDGGQMGIGVFAFSSDGHMLATAGLYDTTVTLWNATTGKELRKIPSVEGQISSLQFSPDSKILAVDGMGQGVQLLEVATGKEALKVNLQMGQTSMVGFSPAGKLLAVADPMGEIRFVHLGSGLTVAQQKMTEGSLTAFAFSPDGKTFAVGTTFGTVLIYNTPTPEALHASPSDISAPLLEVFWADLAGEEASLAYEAMWKLATGGEKAIAFLQTHLQSVPLDEAKVRKFITDLDSQDFVMRDAAHKELEKLVPAAESLLREELEKSASAEVRDRAQKLLKPLEPPYDKFPSDILRRQRAIQALEWSEIAPAKRLLEALAQQSPHSRGGHEAQAAVDRLNHQGQANP